MRYEVWDSRLFNGGLPLYGSRGNEMNGAAYCVSIGNLDFETPKTQHKSTTALFYFLF